MTKFLAVLALILGLSLSAAAQAPAPNEDVKIDLSMSYARIDSAPTVNGQDGLNANVIGVRVPLTDRFAAEYKQIQLPNSKAQIFLGGIEYRRVASEFLKSKSLRFDASKFDVFVHVDLGSKRQDISSRPAFSYSVGGGIDRKIAPNVVLRILDVSYVRSHLERKGLVLSNHLQLGPGLAIRF